MGRGWPIDFDAGLFEEVAYRGRRLEPLGLLVDQVAPLKVLGAGDRAGPLVLQLFGAAELTLGAGINDLERLSPERSKELILGRKSSRLRRDRNFCWIGRLGLGFHWELVGPSSPSCRH